jgi:hypothetical protein
MHGERKGDTWCKVADTPEDVGRLRHEAAVLRAVAHPGVVRIAAVPDQPDSELITRAVDGATLWLWCLAPAEVAGLGSAVATILADLHDLGVAHGSVTADHVLVDPGGRPILCSMGRTKVGDPTAMAGDVADLARCLLECLLNGPGGGPDRVRLTKLLRRAANKPPPARVLSRQLGRSSLGACLPGAAASPAAVSVPLTPLVPTAGGRRRRLLGAYSFRGRVILGGAALVVAASLAVLHAVGPAPAASAPPPAPCPTADHGCRPLKVEGAHFDVGGTAWSVGQRGTVVVLGRWSCRTPATPALLQPADGRIWWFSRWGSSTRPVPGRPAGVVPGATSLLTLPQPGGCDRLAVMEHGRVATVLALRAA